MKKKFYVDSGGSAFIEAVLVTFFLTLILLIAYPRAKLSLDLTRRFLEREHLVSKNEQIMLLFEKAFKSANVLPSFQSVRIHANGMITLPAGQYHSVHQSAFPPAVNSNAISFLHINVHDRYKVLNLESLGTSLVLTLCREGRDKTVISDLSNFWKSFSVDSVLELQGSIRRINNQSDCDSGRVYEGRFTLNSESMFLSQFAGEKFNIIPKNILYLIPIKDMFTFYISTDGDFRRISHVSRDNQPVVRSVVNMVADETRNEKKISQVKITMTFKNQFNGVELSREKIFSYWDGPLIHQNDFIL